MAKLSPAQRRVLERMLRDDLQLTYWVSAWRYWDDQKRKRLSLTAIRWRTVDPLVERGYLQQAANTGGNLSITEAGRQAVEPKKDPVMPPHPFWESMKDGQCARFVRVVEELLRCGLPESDPVHKEEL